MRLKSSVVALAMIAAASLWASPRAAASSISYKGLSLTPAIEQIVLNPGQDSQTFRIRVDNNQLSPVSLQVSALDFKSLGDTGGLAFIGSSTSGLEHKYGLANWIDLPDSVDLPAGGGQFVDFKVNNRSDLAPGGHYAAILFALKAGASGQANRVQLDQVISTLVFVRKSGGEIYGLKVAKSGFSRHLLGWPSSFNVYMQNTGNVQTAPRGTLQVNGASLVFNPNSNLTLPESTRVYQTSLSSASQGVWPKFYQVSLRYRPDGSNIYSTYTARFFYVNFGVLLLMAAFVVLAGCTQPRFRKKAAKLLAKAGLWLDRQAGRMLDRILRIFGK